MSKLEQVLLVEPPNELFFKGPFNVANTTCMTLTNPSENRIMFKIKTTAPKKYCVRPNAGIIEPNEMKDIEICLQACMYDAAEKNKHKFMVQSAIAPAGEVNLDKVWKDIIPDQLMDSRLKCAFEISGTPNDPIEEEPNNFSPKTASTPVVKTSLDSDFGRVAQELQQLREEKGHLQQENLQLKDELVLLKKQVREDFSSQPSSSTWVYLVLIAVILGALGIGLGKFFL